MQEANALSGAHVITLPAGTYALTIPGANEFNGATGDLNVTRTITINGNSTATTIIDGNGLDRVFRAASPGTGLTLNDLTLQNGNPGNNLGGGIYVSGVNLTLARVVVKSCNSGVLSGSQSGGGGIFAMGPSTVTLTDATITQNVTTGPGYGGSRAGGGLYLSSVTTATMNRTTISSNSAVQGGGIVVFGATTLTLTDTTITQNTAGVGGGVLLGAPSTTTMNRTTISGNSTSGGGITGGGGVYVSGSAGFPLTLTLTDTTIGQNSATGSGGGLSVSGPETTLKIGRTTISGNSASQGGGINLASGTVTLSNTTISGNTATSPNGGGAIHIASDAAVTLVNATIASNSSASLGAVRLVSPGQLELRNTIIANSTGAAPANCSFTGTVTNLGNNLEFPGTECGFDLASDRRADPLLRALAANGGTTQTHAFMPGSPAIDAGDDASCAAAPVSGVESARFESSHRSALRHRCLRERHRPLHR